jgi:hypothetical protein
VLRTASTHAVATAAQDEKNIFDSTGGAA